VNIYLINALLVLVVIRQIREHQLDTRALAVPVLAVAAAAVMFLHAVPGGGSDIALDLLGGQMVFYFAATHGAGPAAWTAALVMTALADVLTRLDVAWIRGRRLTAAGTPVIAAPAHAGASA